MNSFWILWLYERGHTRLCQRSPVITHAISHVVVTAEAENLETFADSQDMAVYQTLNEVRRSLPRATIFLEWHNTNPSAVFSASRQEKIGGRVSLSRITWQTKVGRCLSNEFLIASSMYPSYTVFVTLFENYYEWRLLNYYNWRIILIDLIIRDIFIIIIISVFSEGVQTDSNPSGLIHYSNVQRTVTGKVISAIIISYTTRNYLIT